MKEPIDLEDLILVDVNAIDIGKPDEEGIYSFKVHGRNVKMWRNTPEKQNPNCPIKGGWKVQVEGERLPWHWKNKKKCYIHIASSIKIMDLAGI